MMRQARDEAAFYRLVDTLRERFATEGSLPAERTIARQLNVKRHQLRGALEVLRANGEIGPPTSRRGGSGLRREESLIRTTNPIEVIEMRLAIEPSLARLAALRASPLEIARILRAATTCGDVDTGAADLIFHKTIAASTRNNLAAALYTLLRQIGTDVRLRLGNSAVSIRSGPLNGTRNIGPLPKRSLLAMPTLRSAPCEFTLVPFSGE